MPLFEVEFACNVCGTPWKAQVEGSDEGDALYRAVAEARQKRCSSCTQRGSFELKGSEPAES
ncbi:MAG: hypothetical protein ACE5H5_00195 [Nitrospinota bacterium]